MLKNTKEKTMETIKKFKNRKLYSKTTKSYVTLNYLVSKLRNKESFQVVEHGTNLDITSKTLKQALITVDLTDDVVKRIILGE
jgi:polyhydroxyalkanoate synthesis regulator protein